MADGSRVFNPRSARIPVQIPVDRSTIEMFTGSEIMNLSKGGVFIRSDISLPIGSTVDLKFTLPKLKKTVHIDGIVVWSRNRVSKRSASFPLHPSGMGIEFQDVSSKDLKMIEDEIERQMRKL